MKAFARALTIAAIWGAAVLAPVLMNKIQLARYAVWPAVVATFFVVAGWSSGR